MSNEAEPKVVHNRELNRYEIEVEGHLSVLEYTREGNVITYTHTEVPKALEGRGIAGRMAAKALGDAEAEGVQIVPQCSYIETYVTRHPQFEAMVVKPG